MFMHPTTLKPMHVNLHLVVSCAVKSVRSPQPTLVTWNLISNLLVHLRRRYPKGNHSLNTTYCSA